MTPESAQARAALGAHFLDRRHHGWWNWVDLDLLDMRSNRLCVAGQVEAHLSGHGFYTFLHRHDFGEWSERPMYLGFEARASREVSIFGDAQDLGRAWVELITARCSSPPKRPRLWWLTWFIHRERDAEIW